MFLFGRINNIYYICTRKQNINIIYYEKRNIIKGYAPSLANG